MTEIDVKVSLLKNEIDVSVTPVENILEIAIKQTQPTLKFTVEKTPYVIPGNDKHFVYTKGSASNSWSINHNLNKYPSVIILNSAGDEVISEIEYIDLNNIVLTHRNAFSGVAYLN